MGSFGLIAHIYYLINRIRILTNNTSTFNVMMFIAFALYECHAMVDVCDFVAIPLMLMVIIMLVVVERNNENKTEKLPLTL